MTPEDEKFLSLLSGMGLDIRPDGENRRILAASTPELSVDAKSQTVPAVSDLVYFCEAEVNNGGIDQFFFNSAGDYALETVEALEKIGAGTTAAILREACERFPNGQPPIDLGTRRNMLVSTVSPNGEAFRALDDRFFRYEDNLEELLTKWESQQ